ncbi:MAG: class I SAM-dependent methyltransferase [Actinobacteria bacterium]|nr:class I SAM-dependent methyltransferase [Actinomycetota bacterium]
MSLPGKIVEKLMARYPDQSTEVAIRYLPVASILKAAGARKVLEVGSGDLGLAPYSQDFELTGLDRSFQLENAHMTQVTGSATRIPFDERSFDAVISVDSLEHVPPDEREQAVREILRTAHSLAVIAVPSGESAEAQDQHLAERYLQVRGEEYPFFQDHLEYGLPREDDLELMIGRALKGLGRRGSVRLQKNANLSLRSFLMKGWISRNRFYYNLAVLGLMPLAGLLSRLNQGSCYRIIAVIELGGL